MHILTSQVCLIQSQILIPSTEEKKNTRKTLTCNKALANLTTELYWLIDWLIDWCLKPTLAIFQLYRGVNIFYYNLDTYKTLINNT